MNRPSHTQLVTTLLKPSGDILASLSPAQAQLLHLGLGITTEAGELGDAIKAHAIYQKPLDRANVIEELGDLEWFMEALRQQLGITREETLEGNIDKLMTRYAGKYSDQAAQTRVDKNPEANLRG